MREIRSIAIVGSGIIGSGIAMTFADQRFPVVLLDRQQFALDNALFLITERYEKESEKGSLNETECRHRISPIGASLDYEAVRDVDLVIEAVFEEIGAKEDVFRKLDRVLKSGSILATSTSTLDIAVIAAFTGRPEDVIGLHILLVRLTRCLCFRFCGGSILPVLS